MPKNGRTIFIVSDTRIKHIEIRVFVLYVQPTQSTSRIISKKAYERNCAVFIKSKNRYNYTFVIQAQV